MTMLVIKSLPRVLGGFDLLLAVLFPLVAVEIRNRGDDRRRRRPLLLPPATSSLRRRSTLAALIPLLPQLPFVLPRSLATPAPPFAGTDAGSRRLHRRAKVLGRQVGRRPRRGAEDAAGRRRRRGREQKLVQLRHQLPLPATQLRPVRRPAAVPSTHGISVQLHFSSENSSVPQAVQVFRQDKLDTRW